MLIPYSSRLRRLRTEHHQSQKEIAALLGVSQKTYSDYERGRIHIPVRYLLILARYYDVSVDYISGVTNIRAFFPRH